ncbi:YbhB/YbcL family Raf kinase inhibitor-like protein [Fictibacillus sp. B-59209]|uniref:YbhB/YbcL family Raf kinase inhibitor-like protein n=1 Tax=Fictibacillus sp. B-59209 TaxID=3024873 RepID=UPI002E240E7C|nr:YbhB/YbcL family Raf kinase inhibitor-like protein [Fictibacillus sp. B-59209]
MDVKSSGIINGIIQPQYGKFGTQFYKGMPTFSLPVTICNYPEGTRAFSITLIDYDAVPVVGFPFIHWLVANLPKDSLASNESSTNPKLIQGVNSFASPLRPNPLTPAEASRYGGMAPPDKPHVYMLTVFAQCEWIPLQQGFYLNDLYKCLKHCTLATATVTGLYFS